MRDNVLQRIIDLNIGTDTDEFEACYHAQDAEFVKKLQRLFEIIIDDNRDPAASAVAMGRALHILQDFYSHTDWCEGKDLLPLYAYYKRRPDDYDDVGDSDMLEQARGNTAKGETTLDLDKIAAGDSSDVDGAIYFGGGYNPAGKGSAHNRYAADKPGFGRDDPNLPANPGCYSRAENAAVAQTKEFIDWVYNHMSPKRRRMFFNPAQPAGN